MRSCAALCFLLLILISSVAAQDTVHVSVGWNIVGSVTTGAVPEILTTVPPNIITTSFYGYAPGAGYASTDTLGKGLGYWVKVSADGVVIFEVSTYTGCGVKRVNYNGISYGTVLIGGQCWLAQNLNVGVMITGVTTQTNNATMEKYCYNDDSANCGLYGGLYQWDEAMQYVESEGAQGICPAGWHLPTLSEFQTVSSTVGADGNTLKQGGVGTDAGVGTNTSGFSALLPGFRSHSVGNFVNLRFTADFWSSTEYDATTAFTQHMYDGNNFIYDIYTWKDQGFNVRCLED